VAHHSLKVKLFPNNMLLMEGTKLSCSVDA